MRRAALLLAACLVCAAAGARAAPTTLDAVRIAVNDKSLTFREVASLRQLTEQQYRQQYQGAELQQKLTQLDNELVQRLIEDLLLEAQATRLKINVSDKDIEERVDSIVRRQPSLQEQYSDEQLKSFVLKDLLRRRVLAREVDSQVHVQEDDIVAACRKQSLDSREVDVGHILLRDSDDAARAKLLAIRKELLGGADFEQLAQRYSQDPSAATNKGRLGFISRGQFVPEFEQAAFALPVGAVSEPVKTQFGLHLIKVFDQRSKGKVDCAHLDPVTHQSLENQLFAQARETQLTQFLARIRKQADIQVFDTP
jgi:peptidyl-prolyl cis-trans isomerase SurA